MSKFLDGLGEAGLSFTSKMIDLDEYYVPNSLTRATTNFANLARGKNRRENLVNLFSMINNRINSLLNENNENGNRYKIHIKILTVYLSFCKYDHPPFPINEMLYSEVEDTLNDQIYRGAIGCNLSSYIRDYDFNIVLPKYKCKNDRSYFPEDFGKLHGILFRLQFKNNWHEGIIDGNPITAISVSSNSTYHKNQNSHPILGEEYYEEKQSITTKYFNQMGLSVKYFMPPDSKAPLAIYHQPDLLSNYSDLEFASLISIMESFQKIYRPEIYNSNSKAPAIFKPSLSNIDYSRSMIYYDREERNVLGMKQAKLAYTSLLRPYNKELQHLLNACN